MKKLLSTIGIGSFLLTGTTFAFNDDVKLKVIDANFTNPSINKQEIKMKESKLKAIDIIDPTTNTQDSQGKIKRETKEKEPRLKVDTVDSTTTNVGDSGLETKKEIKESISRIKPEIIENKDKIQEKYIKINEKLKTKIDNLFLNKTKEEKYNIIHKLNNKIDKILNSGRNISFKVKQTLLSIKEYLNSLISEDDIIDEIFEDK